MRVDVSSDVTVTESSRPDADGPDAVEEFCPTCGFPLRQEVWMRGWRFELHRLGRWPWLLILFGVVVIATSAPKAWTTYQTIQATREPLVNDIPADQAPALARAYLDDLNRALGEVAIGGIVTLAGLSVWGRRRVQSQLALTRGSHNSSFQTLQDLWAVGETLLVSFAVVALAICTYVVGAQMLAGAPASWTLVEAAKLQMLKVIATGLSIARESAVLPYGWTT